MADKVEGSGRRARQYGRLARQRLSSQLDGFEIVGLMSRIDQERRRFPTSSRAIRCSRITTQALAETKPDAVSINTWPNTHAEYAIKAMEAGCHVFMEKPIATNIEDAEKVVAMARAKNKKLVLGYILRVHPSLDEVHRARPDAGQAAGDAAQPQPAIAAARPGTGTRT